MLIADPLFYLVAIPAITLVGLSKGGFGGALAILGVPLMSLTISPVTAAGILLPILLVMDVVALAAYRRVFDKANLVVLLPSGIAGIAVGWALAAWLTPSSIRLVVGMMAIVFALRFLVMAKTRPAPQRAGKVLGSILGMASGLTSFIAHAGGPPFQIYMLPQRLDPAVLTGTSVIFFAAVNLIKVVPYAALGQLGLTNLAASALLLPVALFSTMGGVYIARHINHELFYFICNLCLLGVGVMLVWQGVSAHMPL